MASCSALLSEEQFQCSICLEVFTNPVTTSCGHNFCKACITQYWDSKDLCQCPMCKKTFDKRPALLINTFISEMAAPFRKSEPVKAASSPDQPVTPAKPEVSCDVCTGTKSRALKSCLMCQTSYCEIHLEPHHRVARLIKHKLIDPVENLEDRMCETHNSPLELFCRTDQTCVCQFCTKGDHKTHDTVSLEEESGKQKAQLGKTGGEVQQMIQERLQKIQEIKLSVEIRKRDTAREISHSVKVFTALVRCIEKTQAKLIELTEVIQKLTEQEAEGFIQDLQQEITELTRRSSELEQLCHTEDHLHLLQSSHSLRTPPHTKDWSQISALHGLSGGTVRTTLSQLEDTLIHEIKKMCGAELSILQYAVDVTLDPDTAEHTLILSKNGKQVREGDRGKSLPDNPKRFDTSVSVLGKQSFSSGRFYYEVQVGGREWFLGVATESIKRKGYLTFSPRDGYWAIKNNGDEYWALEDKIVLLSLRDRVQKVGVFVDYDEGQVSFYNVEARSHIYSYTGYTFTEKLYPFFCPELNFGQEYSAPLVITRVGKVTF